jgi:hypothetical protein
MQKLIDENEELKKQVDTLSYDKKLLQQDRIELDELRELYKLNDRELKGYLPGYKYKVPVVKEGYGWNLFAMYMKEGDLSENEYPSPSADDTKMLEDINKWLHPDEYDLAEAAGGPPVARPNVVLGAAYASTASVIPSSPSQTEATTDGSNAGVLGSLKKIQIDNDFSDLGESKFITRRKISIADWAENRTLVLGIITDDAEKFTINNTGELDGQGGVGIAFEYYFDIVYYAKPKGDLTVVSHTPETADTDSKVTSRVKVKNNSDVDYTGDNKAKLSFSHGDAAPEIKEVEIGPNEEKMVEFVWTAPSDAGKVTVTAHVNPDREVSEYDYKNNKKDFKVDIVQRVQLPDLAVISHRPGTVVTNSVVTSYLQVKNESMTGVSNAKLTFGAKGKESHKYVNLNAGETKDVAFEWLAPATPGAIVVTGHINPGLEIDESGYDNNVGKFNVNVTEPSCDLQIIELGPGKYTPGTKVVTLVHVKNVGGRTFTSGRPVELTLSIPAANFSQTKLITLNAGGQQLFPFTWIAPNAPGDITITAEVNPQHNISETNYNNNKMSVNAKLEYTPRPGCDNTERRWMEERYSHTETSTIVVDGVSETYSVDVYVMKEFYAKVSISAKLIPGDTMKSGYGVECEVTTTIETNYDKPNVVTGIQNMTASPPPNSGRETINMQKISDNTWKFPVNPTSVIGSHNVYVPIDWADDTYFEVSFTGTDGKSPGGSLCATTTAKVYIKGNMYEDDRTYTISY